MNDLSDLSDAELDDLYQRLIGMGLTPQRSALLNQQQAMAQQLMQTPMPGTTFIPHGGVAVANPWGAVASGLARVVGMKQQRDLQAQQQALINQQGTTLRDLMRAIHLKMSGAVPPSQPQPTQQGAPPWVPPTGSGVI